MTITMDPVTRHLIERYVMKCGIAPDLGGFDAIVYAIKYRLDNPDRMLPMMEIYAAVADSLNATPARIERRMRHAITTAFETTHPDYLAELFDDITNIQTGKVTNATFVATLAREIRPSTGQ